MSSVVPSGSRIAMRLAAALANVNIPSSSQTMMASAAWPRIVSSRSFWAFSASPARRAPHRRRPRPAAGGRGAGRLARDLLQQELLVLQRLLGQPPLGYVLVGDHGPRLLVVQVRSDPPHKPAPLGRRVARVLKLEAVTAAGEDGPYPLRERGCVFGILGRRRFAGVQVVGALGDALGVAPGRLCGSPPGARPR